MATRQNPKPRDPEHLERLLQAAQMISIGMSHLLMIAYQNEDELRAEIDRLKAEIEVLKAEADDAST